MIDRISLAAYLLTVSTHASKRADEADAAVARGDIAQIGRIVAQQERQLSGLAGMLSYYVAQGAPVPGDGAADPGAGVAPAGRGAPRPGFWSRVRMACMVMWW